MEVDEKPTEDYNDIGGLDKQIEEMVEAIVLPMTHRDRFVNLGIKPPKGRTVVLIYRLFNVRTSRNWENIACKSMCSSD
jgi:ATP-dependent 26S proteasome regulatory subunit